VSYRDTALERLDVAAFWASERVELGAKVGTDEYRFLCPFHGDTTASANANLRSGLWKCQVCGAAGGPIDWLMKMHGVDYRTALEQVGKLAGLEPPSLARAAANGHAAGPTTVTKGKLTEANVKAWYEAGLRNGALAAWFTEHRGFTPETIERFQLGWDGSRVTIPIRDEAGALVNVRRYQRDVAGDHAKILPLMAGAGPDVTTRLFPGEPLPDDVVLVEGEWDAIICAQHGIDARTMTIGAGNWNPTFTPLFAGKRVTICYDNDEAGRKGGVRVARILANVAEGVRILQLPNLPDKGDVTDFFVDQARSAQEFRALAAEATPFVLSPIADDEPEAVRVALSQASNAAHRGQRLELPVLLSGKAMTPYTVPAEFNVECDMGNKRLCSICPMQEVGGKRHVKISAAEPAVLSLIGVTDAQQYTAIKAIAKAISSCNRPKVAIERSINIEELRLIPELDASQAEGESEYVARSGFFLGHGLLPNRSYAMRGYSHPSPKTQATVHLLSEAEPAQDNISAFVMTPELVDDLKIFRVPVSPEAKFGVAERFTDIYADFAQTVHRIRGRLEMQVAYDLIWHSVIGFTFNGAVVRRGWVEGLVIGDSGQGKTEMAMELLGHYRLGERIQGETTSGAGLIGGLEKMGDTWMLSWGRIPLNDKRLLIVDETQGIHTTQIESMSDVRATGIAEITKIRTERTNARCRIVWLANPKSGLTLTAFNQGVLAIKELFEKPEDVRRLDFAIATATGDVDYAAAINIRHDAAAEPRYSSEVCRALVLWAWSRRPDQVTFTPAATDLILASATAMGQRYHASIPLVEPSDQRLKLARLAVAAAARVYSTDDEGEQVIVRPEHVEFVVDFLTRAYAARGMAYEEYSDSMRRGESLSPEDENDVKAEIEMWSNQADALSFLRTATTFRKADLIDGVGWTDEEAKARLRFLQGKRLIRPTRTGFYKAPAFITLLRAVVADADAEAALDEPDAPF
jgi:CHC2 zinc finger/Toprim-like/MCM P-loop domain